MSAHNVVQVRHSNDLDGPNPTKRRSHTSHSLGKLSARATLCATNAPKLRVSNVGLPRSPCVPRNREFVCFRSASKSHAYPVRYFLVLRLWITPCLYKKSSYVFPSPVPGRLPAQGPLSYVCTGAFVSNTITMSEIPFDASHAEQVLEQHA